MTPGLLKSVRNKAKLHSTFIKNPTLINKEKFTTYRNKFKTLKKRLKRIIMLLNL